jgi:hypothetical protein
MTESELARLYRQGVTSQRLASRDTCAAPEELLAAVERRGAEAGRLRVINHAMGCPACSEELELLRGLQLKAGTARRQWITIGLAASLLLAAGIGSWRAFTTSGDENLVRGVGEGVVLIAPSGDIATAPTSFVWSAVRNARRYEIEIRRDDGTLLARDGTSDTTFVAAAGVPFTPATDYYWTVSARLADGSELGTVPRRFRLVPR